MLTLVFGSSLVVTLATNSPSQANVPQSFHEQMRFAQFKDPKKQSLRRRGYRTSLLPEEKLQPLQLAKPLTTEDAKKLEARKLFVISLMYLKRNQLDKALKVLRQANELNPTSLAILLRLVDACKRTQRGSDAVKYCQQALSIDPENYGLWHLLAFVALGNRDLDTAIDALERASRIEGLRTDKGGLFLEVQSELAQLYRSRQDYEGLARALRQVIEIFAKPEDYGLSKDDRRLDKKKTRRLYERLGSALTKTGKLDEALKVLTDAQKVVSKDERELLNLAFAELHVAKEDYPKALESLDRYIKLQPQDERAYRLYEETLSELGREVEFLSKLEEWAQKDRFNPVLGRLYGKRLLEAKQYEKAEEQLLKFENRPEMLPLLAELFRKMDEPGKLLDTLVKNFRQSQNNRTRTPAFELQLKALGNEPELVTRMAEIARKEIEAGKFSPPFVVNYIIALAAGEAKEVDLSREFYERCIENRPNASLLFTKMIVMLWINKRYSALVESAAKAIDSFPDEFEFYEFQARALAMQGKTAEAVVVLDELIERTADRDNLFEAYRVLAGIYMHAEDWKQAEEVCQHILDEFPDSQRILNVRYLLSSIYTLSGDLSKAQNELLKLVESDPGTVDDYTRNILASANNDLGYLWADENRNLDRAEEMIRFALSVIPDNGAYIDSLGWVLFKKGEFEEAVSWLEKAVKLEDGNDPVIWDHLGDAYRQLNRITKTREAWEKAISLFEEDPERRKREPGKLEQLQKKLNLLENGPSPPPKRATNEKP